MGFWQVTYGGVTQDAKAWGISGIQRVWTSARTTSIKFKLNGKPYDTSPLPFLWRQPMSITRAGQPWFAGWVTSTQPHAAGGAESIDYEISDAWYWLENTPFQQQVAILADDGGALVTTTTTHSETILSQSLNGTKMNSGQVIREVLLYAQYSYQEQDFPNTVTLANLPPAPDPARGPLPFLIGTIDPSITVPYAPVKDKSCADIIILMMKYSPDAVAWLDFSTSPATLNIGRRANLAKKTLSVKDNRLLNGFNPKPRNDLQLPGVIAKFQQTNTVNGESVVTITTQKFPPTVRDNAVGVWVQTIDLVGNSTTEQTADIVVRARPVRFDDAVAMPWILYKESWLKDKTGPGAAPYIWDWANVGCVSLTTAIDASDPLNTSNPLRVPLPDCHTLVNELITSGLADWITNAYDVVAAKVSVSVLLKYFGTDPATAAKFVFDPLNPNTPTAPGQGYMARTFNCKVTNASTQVYSQITSSSAGEPVPEGYAQYLYEAQAPLHFQGNVILVEEECSDSFPVGSVFNVPDGNNPDWKTMNALVLSVTEDLDTGTTTVQFGPPVILGLGTLEELRRANLGRLPSYKLEQRTTGKFTAGATVETTKHAADTNTISPPDPQFVPDFPFQVRWRYNPDDPSKNTFQAIVELQSNLLLSSNLFDNTPITGLNTWFNLMANDTIWLVAGVINYAVNVGTPTIHSYGQGHTDYIYGSDNPRGGGEIEVGGSPASQTWLRKVIVTSIADANGKPQIKQYVQTDLVIVNRYMNAPCIFAQPL